MRYTTRHEFLNKLAREAIFLIMKNFMVLIVEQIKTLLDGMKSSTIFALAREKKLFVS